MSPPFTLLLREDGDPLMPQTRGKLLTLGFTSLGLSSRAVCMSQETQVWEGEPLLWSYNYLTHFAQGDGEREICGSKVTSGAFSGGVKRVKKLCSKAGDVGLTLVGGLRSPCHRATKPAHPRACTLHLEMLQATAKSATVKTQCSRNKK